MNKYHNDMSGTEFDNLSNVVHGLCMKECDWKTRLY